MSEDEEAARPRDDADVFRELFGGVTEGPDARSPVAVWFADENPHPAKLGPPRLLSPDTLATLPDGFNTRLRRIVADRPAVVTIDGRRAYVECWRERALRLDAMIEVATKEQSK